ncbi:hypothetical protein BH10CYA1_BH10CYA1_62190 [soil metagenome]
MFADYLRAELSTAEHKSTLYYFADRLLLSKQLDDSQKMIIGPEVWTAANELCLSKPSSIKSAMPLVRIPYKQLWMEWTEPNFPITWGALITCVDGFGQGYFRVFYRVNDTPILSTGMLVCFDFVRDVNLIPWRTIPWLRDLYDDGVVEWERVMGPYRIDGKDDAFRVAEAKKQWEAAGKVPQWLNNKTEVDAFWELQKNVFVIQDFAFEQWWAWLRTEWTDSQYAAKIVEALTSTMRQASLVKTVLAILNSKNITDQESVSTLPMPNNLRRKMPTQKKLYAHHLLKIDLTKSQRNRAAAYGLSVEEMRAHLVRGHFKVRKSGIFWWSPFVRGSAKEGIVTKDYEISKQKEKSESSK